MELHTVWATKMASNTVGCESRIVHNEGGDNGIMQQWQWHHQLSRQSHLLLS